MKRDVRNVAASVHARLLGRAKEEERPFDDLLQNYVMEQFLRRLAASRHRERFVLKGALMLRHWGGADTRKTKDIDLLGLDIGSGLSVSDAIRECLEFADLNDGLVFHLDSLLTEDIRLSTAYQGVRLRCRATLGNARATLQVDVGFGDAVIPLPVEFKLASAFGEGDISLLGYTPESSIAEKFHAMVVLDMANSRMKDLHDVHLLAGRMSFRGSTIGEAIATTFKRRRTPLPIMIPVVFTQSFYDSPAKIAQWEAWLRRSKLSTNGPTLSTAITVVRELVWPIVVALAERNALPTSWSPGGPWRNE